jgi:hypothetical protein
LLLRPACGPAPPRLQHLMKLCSCWQSPASGHQTKDALVPGLQ